MPGANCQNCGRLTNSCTSNYYARTEPDGKTPKEIGVATLCYAAFVGDDWVEGCRYDIADKSVSGKPWIKKLIAGNQERKERNKNGPD